MAAGIVAWIGDGGFGRANSAAIIEEDGLTVIDSCAVPSRSAGFAAALGELDQPIRRLVYTSSHIDYVGGSTSFPLAAVYGSPEMSAHLDQPPNVDAYTTLAPELEADFAELETRAVTHTVREPAWISTRVVVAPTGGQITENLVAQIPDANVVIAGAMASFGVVPAAWAGDPRRWADQLDVILGWGATIVPGHGPVGGAEEVHALQEYLRACADAAAGGEIADGAWTEWDEPRLHRANVERAAMLTLGDLSPPPAILTLMGLGA